MKWIQIFGGVFLFINSVNNVSLNKEECFVVNQLLACIPAISMLRWLKTVSDTSTAFVIFQKLLMPGSPNFAERQLKG